LYWVQPQDATVILIRDEVDEPVRALPHIAYALAELREYALFLCHGIAGKRETGEEAAAQRADEHPAVPAGVALAGVEGEPGGRDGRIPVEDRLLHARRRPAPADLRAGIVDAIADHRPAIVAAREHPVDLIPAARAVLGRPKVPGLRVERGSLHVAMTVGPDLGLGPRLVPEGIVGRHAAIGVDAHHLAEVARQVLRLLPIVEPVAHGDEERAVAPEDEPRPEMVAAPDFGLLPEDHLHIRQSFAVEPTAHDRRACAPLARLGEREIDEPVAGEGGVDGDVQEPPLARGVDLRHPGDRT
jgi:hypothetical protein